MSTTRTAVPGLAVVLLLGVLFVAVPRGCGYDLVPTQHIRTPATPVPPDVMEPTPTTTP